jgi:hypothetical protein
MLSVIIFCGFESSATGGGVRPDTVVRTLTPLVGASVRGLVRDVVLAGPPGGELGLIAEHAGCVAVESDGEAEVLRRAIAIARGEDILLLRVGYVPEAGFFEELEDVVSLGRTSGQASRVLKAAPVTFYERLYPGLAPVVGFMADKKRYAAAEAVSFQQLRRTIGARQPFTRRLRKLA